MGLGFYKDDSEIFEFLDKNNDAAKTPFILGNNEYFSIFWDLKYFLQMWNAPIYEIAYKTGEFYFSKDAVNKANISMVSGIVSKVYNANKTFEDTVKKLNDMANKPNRTGIKLITDAKTNNDTEIQVLTMHKSKGDEFDHVFIPQMYTDSLSLDIDDIKLKENSKFIETIKTNPKNEDEMKKEILDENFRLGYVAVTRAKKKLYLTCAKEYKIFNKLKEKHPNQLLTDITPIAAGQTGGQKQ